VFFTTHKWTFPQSEPDDKGTPFFDIGVLPKAIDALNILVRELYKDLDIPGILDTIHQRNSFIRTTTTTSLFFKRPNRKSSSK
jgi:hypothetical protein